MEAVLRQLQTVPGVLGALVCNEDGGVEGHAFSFPVEPQHLSSAASILSDSSIGLQQATGEVEFLDIRYGEHRIVVKPHGQKFVFLLCSKGINLSLLSMNLNVAVKKLAKTAMPAPSLPTQQEVAMKAAVAAEAGKGLRLAVELMQSNGGTYWANMKNIVAINHSTALSISNFYKTGGFKKLKLTNPATKRGKSFPIVMIDDDKERRFDGKVIISLATAEVLRVQDGDTLTAELAIGGGIFGWEGV